jgi:hypothetical protein
MFIAVSIESRPHRSQLNKLYGKEALSGMKCGVLLKRSNDKLRLNDHKLGAK